MKKVVISGKEYEYPEYIELNKIEEYFDENDSLINKTASRLKTIGSLLADCSGVATCGNCMLQKKPVSCSFDTIDDFNKTHELIKAIGKVLIINLEEIEWRHKT